MKPDFKDGTFYYGELEINDSKLRLPNIYTQAQLDDIEKRIIVAFSSGLFRHIGLIVGDRPYKTWPI